MNTLRQIITIARTEFRFGYRRPGPAFIAVIAGLAVAMGTVIFYYNSIPNNRECLEVINKILAEPTKIAAALAAGIKIPSASVLCAQISSDFYAKDASVAIGIGIHDAWFAFLLFSLVLITASAAPAIPADRQFGAFEWLRSLPINGSIYLLGKILGLLACALAGSLIPLSLFCIVTLILMHALPMGMMLSLATLDGLPVLIWSVFFGVMIGTPFRKRMNAALVGLGLGLVSLIVWLYAFYSPEGRGNPIDTAAFFIFQRFGLEIGIIGRVSSGQVLAMLLSILTITCLLGLLARLWLNWKENF